MTVLVIGAGGHAKVVISILQDVGYDVVAVFDDNPATWGGEVLGIRVEGPVAKIEKYNPASGVIAIGDNATRKAIAAKTSLQWLTIIHPRAWVHPTARLGPGSIICAGAVIQPDVRIGRHAIINTGAIVDHDCTVGDFAHLAPGVRLAGGGAIGEGTLLGVGACAIPGVRVGNWSIVGAGGVVVRDLPDRVLACGVPAGIKRQNQAP